MREGKKPRGMKHRIREERKREERIGLAIIAAILIALIFISGFIINSLLNQPSTSQTVNSTPEPKAAIVDHLSLTCPNQTFIQTATNTLKQAGYTVDYYPGEQVTVEFYRNLPTHGYKIIILRVHSTATDIGGTESPVALFTSERVSQTKYVHEILTDQLLGVAYSEEEGKKGIGYFGITPSFVTQGMKGEFQNTVIIMMGCEGLHNPSMAKAFVDRGAKVYISWSKPVSASHTDTATTHFLQHFLIEKRTVKEGIEETLKDVGADPTYESILVPYPKEAWDYTIQNIVANSSQTMQKFSAR
jgi:hypothetical protein